MGGGLAGCLAALALAMRRPEVPLLLLEQESGFGGNHIWSFFDTDLETRHRWLVSPLVSHRWTDHEVRFPGRCRIIAIGYNSLCSATLDRVLRERLRPDQYRLGCRIAAIGPGELQLETGERISAGTVVDARGGFRPDGLVLAWQKFLGRFYRFERRHGSARPMIMDATVSQTSGYRFVYTLPFAENELLVEDTYYSNRAELDVPRLRRTVDDYVHARSWNPDNVVEEESGVLPVVLGGDVARLWGSTPVARLGLAGGFFHPTTGYSLPDAVANAAALTEQRDLSSPALYALLKYRAVHLWESRSFYRLLNRLLFDAAPPLARYRVLEHFYRLPMGTIARFYAGRLSSWDKLRILSGRPPVRLGGAIKALRARAA
ncbi:MAG: lycopene beta-cyclase CrtY [Alphaproteobacteria bacterium]|nr:lycopene beta-cyclase CrtY [Alphaproteobacteria bacterium]